MMLFLSVCAAAMTATTAGDEPITCQPKEVHPRIPIFHIIGNVTQLDSKNRSDIKLAPINDASAVVKSGDVYHIFHQCCQNHWDHVVSKDLVHWQRLPSPVAPSADPVRNS